MFNMRRGNVGVRLHGSTRRTILQTVGGALGIAATGGTATGRSDAGAEADWSPPPDEPIDRSAMEPHLLDVSDGDDLAPIVDSAMQDDRLLIIPDGDYEWRSTVFNVNDHSNLGLQGESVDGVTLWFEDGWGIDSEEDNTGTFLNFDGRSSDVSNFLFENFSMDSEGRAEPRIRCVTNGGILFHRLKWKCPGTETSALYGGEKVTTRSAGDPDGHSMVVDAVCHNRGSMTYNNQTTKFLYSSSVGRLTIRRLKASGFSDNCIYTRMEGPMTVENCVIANTNPSCIRVGGDNEIVRNCTFYLDTDRDVELTELTSMNGIMADRRGNASDGGTVENCSFITGAVPGGVGCIRMFDNRRFTVENTQFLLDDPDFPGIGVQRDVDSLTLENVRFDTSTASGATAAQPVSGAYEASNICVDEDLDAGALSPDSTDCAFDWKRAHPFPDDHDFTFLRPRRGPPDHVPPGPP